VVLGAVLGTLVLGVVNWMVGREAVFFSRLVDLVVLYITDANFQAGRPLSNTDWLLTARHLAVPLAVALAGVASLLPTRERADQRQTRLAAALVVQFLAMALLWAVWQSAGHTALDWDYMAYALTPCAFLALAGILSRGWPDWYERHWLGTVLAPAGVLTLFLVLERLPGARALAGQVQSFVFVAGALILFAPLVLYRWWPSVASAALVVAVFAFDNRLVSPGHPDYFAADRCKIQPAVYGAIVDAASWAMSVDPLYTRARIWFDEKALIQPLEGCPVRVGHMANSITTMASMAYVAKAFPLAGVEELPDESVLALAEGLTLVIVSTTPGQLDEWSRRLEGMGLTHRPIASHEVPVMQSRLWLHAWSVARSSP
jgi:hypothetical protein